MFEEEMSTAELLEQWREATRAAELAARLARMAAQSVERTSRGAERAEELAQLAERAATAATEAAATARRAAEDALALARESTMTHDREAATLGAAEAAESDARRRYHDAEGQAHSRLETNGF